MPSALTNKTNSLDIVILAPEHGIWRWQADLLNILTSDGFINIAGIVTIRSAPEISSGVRLLHRLDSGLYRESFELFDRIPLADLKQAILPKAVDKAADIEHTLLINFSETVDVTAPKTKGILQPVFSSAPHEGESMPFWQSGIDAYQNNADQMSIGVVLKQSLSDKGELLAQSFPSFDSHSALSQNLNRINQLHQHLWRRACMHLQSRVADALRPDHAEKAVGLDLPDQNMPSPVNAGSGKFNTIKSGTRFVSQAAAKLSQKFLRQEQWQLMYSFGEYDLSDADTIDFSAWHRLQPPEGYFWADPFVCSRASRHFIFLEELPFATEKGYLSCLEVFPDGSSGDAKIIIEQDWHLSYPNVFEYEGQHYLIAESGDIGRIDVYKCKSFPWEWEFSHSLIDGIHAYDSTLIEHAGQWWLFATVAAEKGMSGNEELCIFHADSPHSQQWQAHAGNPVISNAATARPAGKFFRSGEVIYRPSQNCAGHYGASLNINAVDSLTADSYQERSVATLRPDWDKNLIALHTLNSNKHLAVIDVLCRQSER